MYHDDSAGTVAVGVGIFFGGASMGGPAGVADAESAFDGMLAQDCFKIGEFARSAAHLERWARRTADGDARRIVSAVFEAP